MGSTCGGGNDQVRIGMERLAMMLYKVPDIRCFWSEDPGFKNQFVTDDVEAQITYRVSR